MPFSNYVLLWYGIFIKVIGASGQRNGAIAWDWEANGVAVGVAFVAATAGANPLFDRGFDPNAGADEVLYELPHPLGC